jgi:kinetochore protein Fta7
MRFGNREPGRSISQPKQKPQQPRPEASQLNNARNKKRKSTETDAVEGGTSTQTKRPRQEFSYLKPRTRQVPQDVITRQWRALPESAQQQVRSIVNAAKRSVTYSSRDLKRAHEAEVALDRVIRLIHQRLPRMPFPKNSKDVHFDLDKVLERNVGCIRPCA